MENLRAAVAPRAVVAELFFDLRLDGPATGVGLIADASSVVWTENSGVEVDLEVVVVAQLGQSRLRSAVAVGALFRRWPRHWGGRPNFWRQPPTRATVLGHGTSVRMRTRCFQCFGSNKINHGVLQHVAIKQPITEPRLRRTHP